MGYTCLSGNFFLMPIPPAASFNFTLALRRYTNRLTHLHTHWLHTATLHEICCPGLSRSSDLVLFLFICCAYAWDFFLTIFLEVFADVISTDFLHRWCFALLEVFAAISKTMQEKNVQLRRPFATFAHKIHASSITFTHSCIHGMFKFTFIKPRAQPP